MSGRSVFGGAAAVAAALLALAAPTAEAASTCNVSTSAELTTAVANVNCDPIVLAAGTYSTSASPAVSITRGVTLTGAGVGQTIITRTGSGNIFSILGSDGDKITLSGMTISGATAGSGIVSGSAADITIDLANVDIRDNTATVSSGGGIYFGAAANAVLNVTDSTIALNTSGGFQGGGVNMASSGTANFNRVLFVGNRVTGSGGGGGYSSGVTGAETNFTDVTFSNNRASNNGGAIRNSSDGTIILTGATIATNTADDDNAGGGDGGGIFNDSGTVSLRDSIVAGNADLSGGALDCSGNIVRLGYELVKSPTGCTFAGAGDTSLGYQTGVDPLLAPLANNGGPTQTRALGGGSPALDAIPAGSCGTSVDQRNLTRPQGTGCDLGAFEREVVVTPPPTGDTTPPETAIGKAKVKRKKRSAKFSFSSSEAGSTFECRLDDKAFTSCDSPQRYRHLKRGKHTFEVAATDPAGNLDPTPAETKFKIRGHKHSG